MLDASQRVTILYDDFWRDCQFSGSFRDGPYQHILSDDRGLS